MSGHQQSSSLNHHHQHPHQQQQQQQAATSPSSRLGVVGADAPPPGAVPGYQQQVPALDAGQYPRAMCAAAAYNGGAGSTPTAAHQGSALLTGAGYSSPAAAAFGGGRGNSVPATPGHASLAGPSAHAASYCMPMGQSLNGHL